MLSLSSGLLLLVTFLVTCVIIVFLIYTFRTIWLIHLYNRFRVYRAGLSKHFLKITDELVICYLERKGQDKDADVLIFIHGFSSDKLMYCDIIPMLTAKFHVLAIDLPGHGESQPSDENHSYTISSQVEYLHKFIEAFGFNGKKLTLVGSSMGGNIAGVYASKYSDTLSSVVLVCPGGIESPKMTEFLTKSKKDVEENKGTNALMPETYEAFTDMLKLILYHSVSLPRKVIEGYLQMKTSRKKMNQKLFNDLTGCPEEYFLLDISLEHITIPLLCVWGEHDMILHPSGAEVIGKKVKDAEIHMIERCGHGVFIDRPGKFIKILLTFLAKNSL